MRSKLPRLFVALLTGLTLVPRPALADVPYPAPAPGQDPYAYHTYAFLSGGSLPNENVKERLEYSCNPTGDPLIDGNPQELFGIKGPCVTKAWETTTGRPDVTIAVLDSGINWPSELPDLRRKTFLNRGELPMPEGGPNLADRRFGGYDLNGDGVFNIDDYATDSRVGDLNANGVLDPEDLILDPDFANGVDSDQNGYIDDIAGWDFFEDDNNPRDEPRYGHGTGEAHDSSAEGNNGGSIGICPNCMFMPLRVGDSFIADVQHWAEAVLYATDNGASVVQEALGTLNNSRFGQEATDYAWKRGVIIVASAADEEATHHNYPSNYNHTMVVNSIRNRGGTDARRPDSYLYLNGCTNFGGHIHVAVPGESCSSEATGRGSGMAGLVYSAALNELDRGDLSRYPRGDGTFAPFALSADEVKQIFRATADDINFSDPASPTFSPPFPGASADNYAVVEALPTERYHSVKGWDQFFGYGRTNSRRMVELVAATTKEQTTIPPEAELNSPLWFEILPGGRKVDLVGRVAANRAPSYSYRVQWAAGVQPPEYPAGDAWYDLIPTESGTLTSPHEGVLATLDTGEVQAAIARLEGWQIDPAREPTSKSMPERLAVRVRVQVVDNFGNLGEDQKQMFVHDDAGLVPGWPKQLDADGASSVAFADLDDDGVDEMIVGTSNGEVHAFKADGTELSGWPAATDPGPAASHETPALGSGEITLPVRGAILIGSPLVADLDRDGDLEVLAADLEGKVYAWEHDGSRRAGFPVSVDRRFSQESFEGQIRNRFNRVDWGINSAPAAGDLDGNDGGRLEIVFGANDSHVYAFNDDSTPVPGWPVLLRDPAKVASVDPDTHRITFLPGANHQIGTKILPSPSLGDLDGDGDLEVVIGVNEEYIEDPNWSINNATAEALAQVGLTDLGNGRLYALDHRGNLAPQEGDPFPAFPNEQAFLPGWPVKVAMLTTELLPYVGTGINGAAPLADIDGDGDLEIGVFSFLGPGYIFDHSGVSIWGRDGEGHDIALASERDQYGSASDGADAPAFPSLGGGIFTKLTPAGVNFASPGGGLLRLFDVVLSAHQLGTQDYALAWDLTVPGGTFLGGFPREVNDLQFVTTPASADIDGDGVPELLGGTAVYDVFAINAAGAAPLGWPKFTGGWTVAVPAVGDPDGDGKLEVAQVTREGWMFLWDSEGPACGVADWPKAQHDLWNTSNLHLDAVRPRAIRDLAATQLGKGRKKVKVELTWTAPGDDGACGSAKLYVIRASKDPILDHQDWLEAVPVEGAPDPSPAGSAERVLIEAPGSDLYFAVRSTDEAGNLSWLSNTPQASFHRGRPVGGAVEVMGSAVLGMAQSPANYGGLAMLVGALAAMAVGYLRGRGRGR